MTVLRLFIPGSFEDAQLYMGHLVAFSDDREVHLLDLQPFTEEIEDSYGEWKGIATAAFARNDWLASAQVRTLMKSPELALRWEAGLQRVAVEPFVAEVGPKMDRLLAFATEGNVLLDSNLYGQRLYLGTDRGLFHFDIDWQEYCVYAHEQRTDARCIATSAAWGAINASCEAAGLLTAYDEFGWSSRRVGGRELEETAKASLRSSWLGHDLVNYVENDQADLLSGSVEKVEDPDGERLTRHELVTEFSDDSRELGFLFGALKNGDAVPASDVQFLWNSSRAFFVNTFSHGFFTLVWDRGNDRVRAKHHAELPGRVVAVHPFSGGWLIETDFVLLWFRDGEPIALFDREPLMVRTFGGSKRFRGLVAVVADDGIHLLSVVDPVA